MPATTSAASLVFAPRLLHRRTINYARIRQSRLGKRSAHDAIRIASDIDLWIDTWETTNLHQVSTVLTAVAGLRAESRGGHVRRDFPDRDDVRWRGHQTVRLDEDGRLLVDYEDMGLEEGVTA